MTKRMKMNYLRKILNASLCNKNYSTVIFHASFCLDDMRDVIEELKDEYHIKNLIIIDFDNDKVQTFFESDPTNDEIRKFIPKFKKPVGNTKIIYFNNPVTDLSNEYYSDYSVKYYGFLKQYNKEVFDKIESLTECDKTVTCYPNKAWAESLLGDADLLGELWIRINKTLLDPNVEKREIIRRIERKNELNKMKIRNLTFHTDLGTDFRISLNPHSIWVSEPDGLGSSFSRFNYPSYEIFTSPNCYSGDGKIVLSKKRRFYYDITVDNATFTFERGKLIDCESNSETFDKILLRPSNKMNRIGEIALVSQNTPLARTGQFYDSIILDENTGCHFALGNSLRECIGIDDKRLEERGKRQYHYFTSDYHTDYVFGDDSISVEAETKGKQKVLLMDNGRWKI